MPFRLYILLFICVNFSACSIYTEFNVHKPIEIKRLKEADAIIIINRCPAKTPNAHQVFNFLKEYLVSFNHYKSVIEIPRKIYVNGIEDSLQRALEWYEIDSICKKLNAEYIISLEEYTEFTHHFFRLKKKHKDELFRVKWRIYSSEKPSIVYEYFKSYNYYNYFNDTGFIHRFLMRDNKIYSATQLVAFEIANKASDFWVDIQQSYYISGNKMIKQAALLTYENKWTEAANIWLDLIEHSSMRVRRYAFHNLAVYYAGKGNYFTAIEFLEQSLAIKQNTYSKEMLNILKEQLYIETNTLIKGLEQKYLTE